MLISQIKSKEIGNHIYAGFQVELVVNITLNSIRKIIMPFFIWVAYTWQEKRIVRIRESE